MLFRSSLMLTPAEYEILSYLIKQHSFSVSREQLVYNCKSLKDKDSKSLDVIIGKLRTKIGDSSKAPKHIFSVRENRSMENDADLSDMALSNVEALALGEQGENDPFPPINPMCPNGCLANGSGCLCHIWHKDLKKTGKN